MSRLDGVREAAVDVVLDEEERDTVSRGRERFHLLEYIEAVRLLLHETLDAAHLALDAPQARDERALVLGVAVPEVGDVLVGLHTEG